jgi:hypothetical protein
MVLIKQTILQRSKDKSRLRLVAKAQLIAQFLNETDSQPKQKRVLEFMHACKKLGGLLPKIRPTKLTVSGTDQRLYDLTKNREARGLLKQINQRLGRWKFRKTVDRYMIFAPGERPSLSVTSECLNPGKFSKTGREPMLEADVCGKLLELLEADFLRVRKCKYPKCSDPKSPRWFVAERSDANYCPSPSKCAVKHYGQTHRKELTKYMRKYRDPSRRSMEKRH